jgi:signal transduction histidine kinase
MMTFKSHSISPGVGSRSSLEYRYKQLQKEVLEISAREQQRIGQDLHDDLCQQLTAITLLTEVLEEKLSNKSQPEAADAEEIHKLIAQAIVQTRLLAKGLLPIEVPADGLLPALETMAANAEKLSKISCRAYCDAPLLIRNGTVAVHLYRIAQEAVANAAKHSQAKRIAITLSKKNGHIALSITDDGIGIPTSAMHRGGLGLSIMSSRAETINASLHIRRGEKRGTIVTCLLSKTIPSRIKAANKTHRKRSSW